MRSNENHEHTANFICITLISNLNQTDRSTWPGDFYELSCMFIYLFIYNYFSFLYRLCQALVKLCVTEFIIQILPFYRTMSMLVTTLLHMILQITSAR